MATYKFESNDQLMNFLFQAKNTDSTGLAFDSWEITYISLKTSAGLELAMNTKITDTSGNTEYMIWKKIKSMIKTFLDQNGTTGMTMDIRLLCPSSIKNTLDPKNSFSSFRISMYSGSGVIMINSTAIENTTPALVGPLTSWNTMVDNIYTAWQTEYDKQYL